MSKEGGKTPERKVKYKRKKKTFGPEVSTNDFALARVEIETRPGVEEPSVEKFINGTRILHWKEKIKKKQ